MPGKLWQLLKSAPKPLKAAVVISEAGYI